MSHPLLGDFHYHGFPLEGKKAVYIRAVIDPSVTPAHVQALGEAIHRCNEAVGARFLLVPDQGEYTITFLERRGDESPFRETPIGGGITLLIPGNPQVYGRSDMQLVAYYEWVNIWAHEIGHCFGLDEQSHDDINSIMSAQVSGRWLFSPSKEDVESVAAIHGLNDIRVRPKDLEGIENITVIWNWDRFHGTGWRWWIPWMGRGTIEFLVPYETYQVRAKAEGLLGLRQLLDVKPGLNRWVFLYVGYNGESCKL